MFISFFTKRLCCNSLVRVIKTHTLSLSIWCPKNYPTLINPKKSWTQTVGRSRTNYLYSNKLIMYQYCNTICWYSVYEAVTATYVEYISYTKYVYFSTFQYDNDIIRQPAEFTIRIIGALSVNAPIRHCTAVLQWMFETICSSRAKWIPVKAIKHKHK